MADQALARLGVELQAVQRRPAPGRTARQVRLRQALQHIDRGARQQRGIDLEGRVLGGGADEGHRAALDIGQEGILLRLVEAMHLVDEQDGAAPLLRHHLGLLHRLADVLDAGKHRRERDELGIEAIRHQARQRGLADARRAPEDHRMRRARGEGQAQRLALADQMALADHLGSRKRARPHLLRQQARACHCPVEHVLYLGGVHLGLGFVNIDCLHSILRRPMWVQFSPVRSPCPTTVPPAPSARDTVPGCAGDMNSEPVQRADHAAPALVQHMRINHRGGHVRMAEQFLHRADVIARLQQVCGE
jgi:hypothetical protein